MKIVSVFFFCFCFFESFSQLELSTGYAVNKNLADGAPLQIAYDLAIGKRLYAKPQIGYKYLYHLNNHVGAVLKVSILELHQTLSYELVKTNNYIFKPNVGVNYRFYHWQGKMQPPYETLPQRVYRIEFRNDKLRLNSFDNQYSDEYKVNNFGFSFQLQSQVRLTKKLWFHVTPFFEPDFDGTQNTGGCYVGIVLKNL